MMNNDYTKNTIAQMVKIIGIIIIVAGVICGFIFGKDLQENFSLLVALIYWISSIISGIVFLAIGEVVQLLQNLCSMNDKSNTAQCEQIEKDNKDDIHKYVKNMKNFDIPQSIK